MNKIQILDIDSTKKLDSFDDLISTQRVKEIFGGCRCEIQDDGKVVCPGDNYKHN